MKNLNTVQQRDILEALKETPDNSIDMVYSDPDYNVGINYSGNNYTKKWNDYIDWYGELIRESMRVLKPEGNLFTINYPKQNAFLWVNHLDEIASDVWEYAWVYNTNVGHSKRRFTTAHRTILHATKTKENKFFKNQVAMPYQNPEDKRIQGRIRDGHLGRMPYSWIYENLVKNVSKDKTIHACQIPVKLYNLLMQSCTQENDTVFIHFGGSGSEIIEAIKAKRKFMSCEIHPDYYKMINSRIANGGKIDEAYNHPSKKIDNSALPLLATA